MIEKNQFTQNTLLSKILEEPHGDQILMKYNIPCLSCPFLNDELGRLTIGEVGKMYDIDLKNLLKELNINVK